MSPLWLMASEKELPLSMRLAQERSASRSCWLWVCSVTILRARIKETPAPTMVASWRAMTAKSFFDG